MPGIQSRTWSDCVLHGHLTYDSAGGCQWDLWLKGCWSFVQLLSQVAFYFLEPLDLRIDIVYNPFYHTTLW